MKFQSERSGTPAGGPPGARNRSLKEAARAALKAQGIDGQGLYFPVISKSVAGLLVGLPGAHAGGACSPAPKRAITASPAWGAEVLRGVHAG
jgi:hypothetical protein